MDEQDAPSGIFGHPFVQALPGLVEQGAELARRGVQELRGLPKTIGFDKYKAEARKRMRMERARQQYERSFGRPSPGGPSMAWQGNPEYADYLLARIREFQ